ncbi:MAG: hypothetical protein DMG50_11030 [Acidobacteria bacterium]|nr:MAG: hypothetical protein DMG50_11030 [Acidobacteriota bacterium]
MSADSQRTACWETGGIPFRELIDKLIEQALGQQAEKARTKYQIKLHRRLRRRPRSLAQGKIRTHHFV